MKRILLSVVLISCTFYLTNAQVIDLVGNGILGETSANLALPESNNIEKVEFATIYKGERPIVDPPANGVLFSDNNEKPKSIYKKDFIDKNGTTVERPMGYYTASFTDFDDGGINATISIDHVNSFYAFVYRNIPNATYKSYRAPEIVYFYGTGASDPYVYTIDIEPASYSRNIKVKIPITELADDNRVAVIDIKAGDVEVHAEVYTHNLKKSFFIGEYILANVPGNISKVEVSIYSPTKDDSIVKKYRRGDSFFVSGVVADVDIEFIEEGCTLTQGYWKTHSNCKSNGNGPERDDTWDKLPEAEETEFFLSEQNYCEVFDTKPSNRNGKYYILAHQYIAAELNILAGANPTEAQAAFDEATIFLETYTPGEVKGNDERESKCVELGGILADFNEGKIGPGHCDDEEEDKEEDDDEAEIQPVNRSRAKVSMYPNPANGYSKISYTPKQDGKTRVEMYNVNGQKIAVLFNKKTIRGVPVTIEYNTDKYKKGLYFVIIRNGSDVYKEKISILN